MKTIRTIAIDDEPLALQLVTGYITKTPFLEHLGSFDSPLTAMEFLENNPVDLIYLDIQMPDLMGTEFARINKESSHVIFTTAFPDYAVEGFRLNALDYLLKPFSYEEFLESARRAKQRVSVEQPAIQQQIETSSDFLFIKSDYKVRRINLSDIQYIEGLKDYVKVYLHGDPKPVLTLATMKQMEGKLPPDRFMRVHRSFIVNLQRIEIIERSRIVFGNVYIPISDQYKEGFQKFVDRNFI
ncbi:MAG: response regulator transcription factor [Lentimicrobium sp.]|nr:response regulator transcription factor [Lentimicrobium sp.]